MSKTKITVLTVLLALVGWRAIVWALQPSPEDCIKVEEMVRLAQRYDPAQIESLERGREIATTRCVKCHLVTLPEEYTPEEWPYLVKRMSPYSGLGVEASGDLLFYMVEASGLLGRGAD